MSVEKFKISKSSEGFVTIPNKVVKALSKKLELLGLYSYLLHLPKDWVFYKTEIKKSVGVGIKKLERMLGTLAQMNLVTLAQMRNAQGHFAQIDICVHDGTSFKNINLEDAQPCVKNRTAVIRTTDMGSYKRNTNKTKTDKQNISKNYCASDDARMNQKPPSSLHFDSFWEAYPRKKDKARARQFWQKMHLDGKAQEILSKLDQQKRLDAQWQNQKFIPHPATYLRNERWEDSIEQPQNLTDLTDLTNTKNDRSHGNAGKRAAAAIGESIRRRAL